MCVYMPPIDRSLSDCRYWGMQGGALCQAKHAKCDKGAKPPECGQALAQIQKIPDKFMTGDAWWMKGQIHKNVYDDVQAAVEGQHTSPTPHLDFRLDFHYLDPPVNRHQITVRRPWAATHSLISRERADRLVASTAMGGAVKRIDYNAGWFDKLARWSQMLHHRLPEGGFNNHASC